MTFSPVIISGGAGSRLWPLSREAHPKPFIELPAGGTLIGKTFERVAALDDVTEVLTVTNRDHLFLTIDAYAQSAAPECARSFILEPVGRDTAAAIALAALRMQEAHGADCEILVVPADHLITDQPAFAHAVLEARKLARENMLVTFGVQPTRPDTGFGYIEVNGDKVRRFVEKPDAQTAEKYLADGGFLWNSGMFVFQAGTMLAAMSEFCPDVLEGAKKSLAGAVAGSAGGFGTLEVPRDIFAATPAISIDYAVMEKARNAACVRVSYDWSDIGSWIALAELSKADDNGNQHNGDALFEHTRDTFVYGQERLVALLGVSDLLVIDTPDALLVAGKNKAQEVKSLYGRLKSQGHDAAKLHRTAHRPWGTYTVLEEGERFKIKRIEVRPGHTLSLQAHNHRSEHWVVVSGAARVVNGDEEIFLATNQSTYIPCGHRHRLENPGLLPLVLIEVQSGDYVGEDDIVRFEDVYGRVPDSDDKK